MSFLPRNGDGDRPGRGSSSQEGGEAETGPDGGPLGRTLALTALGTLVPGAGLSLTRRRRVGLVLLGVSLVALAVLVVYVVRRGLLISALDLAARPGLLWTLAVTIVVGALVWCSSIIATAVISRPARMGRGQRSALTLFTGLMCLAVAAPAAVGLRYIDAHTNAVEAIFAGKLPGSGGGGTASPDTEADDPWEGTPRVNVLLLGSDAGDNREGVRTDSMMVASVDTASGDTVLFGIPRNLQNVPIPSRNPLSEIWPEGYNCGNECLMNGIWTEAEAQAELHPELFAGDPDPGLTATQDVISEILGIGVDNTVILDLDGFSALVDAMGGVEITVRERIPIGGRTATDAAGNTYIVPGSISGWIEEGTQHMDGRTALWFARSRATTDDFSRMRRQRCMVGALLNQVNPMNMLQRYPALAAAAGDNIQTDVAERELPAWVELVLRIQDATIESLPFTLENTNVVDPDYAGIRERVQEAINPPTPTVAPSSPTVAPTTPTGEPDTATAPEPETTGPSPTETTDELSDLAQVC